MLRQKWCDLYVHTLYTAAQFSNEDTVLIKTSCGQKGCDAGQFVTKSMNKGWTKSTDTLLLKLRKYATVDSSGWQRIARPNENVDVVESPVLSQDNMDTSN